MPLHVAQRLHAYIHSLFESPDEIQTRELYHRVRDRFQEHGVDTALGRQERINAIVDDVLGACTLPVSSPQASSARTLIQRLFDYEQLWLLPAIDWREQRTVAGWWELRDQLNCQKQLVEEFDTTLAMIVDTLVAFIQPILAAAPAPHRSNHEITVQVPLIHALSNIGEVTERAVAPFFDDDLVAANLFTRLAGRLERNLIAASGGSPTDPSRFNRAPKPPSKSDINNPEELVSIYLGGTPLLAFFEQTIEFSISTQSRFEHHHIVAGSGHGKTQTLQYLISHDLEAVAAGKRSVVVFDSQGDLIRNISSLALFAPGGPLHDRVVIIDPTDVEYPMSLNLFDVGMERLSGYAPLERERLQNSILELYDFVLGSLLAAEMTQKQSVIFRYVTRLMLHIPDATIHTLRGLMEPGSAEKFAPHIAKLEGTARQFFETEFSSKEFGQTKKQVLRRLWGILENQTFERMFSHPRSKLDLFAELNAGKVVLINTAKDLLKEHGTEIFGRFFIALIAQAAQERATLPEHKRIPTFVYVDEAADYFDRNIGIILSTARKYNVGMVLAHQYLGQLEPRLQEAFFANTSIKFAGGVSAKDARTLAPMLQCEPRFIESQSKGSFAAFVRGQTPAALPLRFPFGYLEGQPHMSAVERACLRSLMRERYAVHYTSLHSDLASADQQAPADEADSVDPIRPDAIDTDAGDQW